MTKHPSAITRLLLPNLLSEEGVYRAALGSIGIVVDDGRVYWGDLLVGRDDTDSSPTILRLVDLCEQTLRGQGLSNFRELWAQVETVFPLSGKVPVADAVRGAVQQGVLAAVAHDQRLTIPELLQREYLPAGPDLLPTAIPIILEVSDFAATAELIDHVLNLRPAGIGYRLTGDLVAESIGAYGEFLERFVNELGQRADRLESGYRPIIYLGMNGAFGRLVAEPIQHIGQILAHCIRLQEATGDTQVIIEDPLFLDDPATQSANLLRLKNLLDRAPSSLDRRTKTLLVERGRQIPAVDIFDAINTRAVHGMTLEPVIERDISKVMEYCAGLMANDMPRLVTLAPIQDSPNSTRWARAAVDVAVASRALAIVVNIDNGNESLYAFVNKHLAELRAWYSRNV